MHRPAPDVAQSLRQIPAFILGRLVVVVGHSPRAAFGWSQRRWPPQHIALSPYKLALVEKCDDHRGCHCKHPAGYELVAGGRVNLLELIQVPVHGRAISPEPAERKQKCTGELVGHALALGAIELFAIDVQQPEYPVNCKLTDLVGG